MAAGGTAASSGGRTRVGGELARGSTFLFAGQLLGNAAYFAGVAIVARALGPADRGTLAFIVVSALIAACVSRLGVNEATIVFAAARPHERPRLLTNLLLNTLATSAVAGALVFGFLAALGSLRPAGLTLLDSALLGAAVAAVAIFEAGNQFLLGAHRFLDRAALMVLMPSLYSLTVLVVWLSAGLTIVRAALIWIGMNSVYAVLVWARSLRGIGFGRPDAALLVESVRFGVRAWVGSLSDFLNFRTDQLLLGVLAAQSSLGIYAVAVNLSEVLLYLPDSVAKALLPMSAGGGTPQSETVRSFRRLAALTLVTMLGAALVVPPLIPAVFGHAFRGAATPFLLLLPGSVGFASMRVFSSALAGSLRPGLSSIPPSVSLVSGLALDILLIPFFGADGAAIAASAAFFAGGIAAAVAYRTVVPFRLSELVPRPSDLPGEIVSRLWPPVRGLVVRSRSLRWILTRSGGGDGIRFLFYHRVTEERDELAVTPERFAAQMEFLAREGFRVVDVVTAGEMLAVGRIPPRTVCLSFDDGFRDVAENALPVLRQHGFRATVFVSTAVVDGRARFDWYDEQPPVLNWDEIRALDAERVLRFEAHTLSHPHLPHVEKDAARREIEGSKRELEAALGRLVRAFCYPAGLLSARERELVAEAGFEFATTCEPGLNRPETDPLLLRRVQVDPRDRLLDFRAKTLGGHDTPPLARAFYRRLRYGVASPPTA